MVRTIFKLGIYTLASFFLASAALAGEPSLRALSPGLEWGFLDAGETVRQGSGRVAVLRIDPSYYTFRVLAALPGKEGHTAGEWRTRAKALAVFNAGQYIEDGSYLGLLVREGKVLSSRVRLLKGLFVSRPRDRDQPAARVIDLRYTPYDHKSGPYLEVAQSLMLLDRFGHVRVRRSPRVAHRTVMAEDQKGRILVVVTEGGHTLWELAGFLSHAGLGLREVMCMDGGGESQISLEVGEFSYEQFGGPPAWPSPPLPAALCIYSRKNQPAPKP